MTLPFSNFTYRWGEKPMPALFIGHGSPTNGIDDNTFSRAWHRLGHDLPMPQAILCISAHWLTTGTQVTAMASPRTIHDFGGFPRELFEVEYKAPGHPLLANDIVGMLEHEEATLNQNWGLDHGCWTILRHMYPEANIPVLQLSIDYSKPAEWHYHLGQHLKALRKRGVLIVGSGNMIHNLSILSWEHLNDENYGFDWALELNDTFKGLISSKKHKELIEYQKLGAAAQLAIPTPDHYYPMLYTLALQESTDEVVIFNDACVAGSLSMTSFIVN